MNPTAWNLKGYTGYVSLSCVMLLTLILGGLASYGVDLHGLFLCGHISDFQKPKDEPLMSWIRFSRNRSLRANLRKHTLTHSMSRRLRNWLRNMLGDSITLLKAFFMAFWVKCLKICDISSWSSVSIYLRVRNRTFVCNIGFNIGLGLIK